MRDWLFDMFAYYTNGANIISLNATALSRGYI